MIKVPNGNWRIEHNSDKYGSVHATKNINFDEDGYLKLSPRMVKIADSGTSTFSLPSAIGKYAQGEFQVIATSSGSNFVLDIDTATLSLTEDTGTGNPGTSVDSHGKFFDGRWFVSEATKIWSKAANGAFNATWTDAGISLTTGVRHNLEVFDSRVTICAANGNVVKQYTNSSGTLTNTIDLTIPTDFEIVGLAYNYGYMGVITRAGAGSTGQVREANFYLWGGALTAATGYGVSSDACVGIAPYKSSFVILTRSGQLKYFNGGGFDDLASFPFFFVDKYWGGSGNFQTSGDVLQTDGDVIYINVGSLLNPYGREQYQFMPSYPGGMWCYDPKVGLYHRQSPSNSLVARYAVTSGNVNTTTDVMTVSSGTVPATGNVARYIATDGSAIGGLQLNEDYYLIKASASTFKLATTRDNAINGVSIDITGTGGDTNSFLFFTIEDYGQTLFEHSGGIGLFGESNNIYRDFLTGSALYSTALASTATLSMTVPFLENRGWYVSPKFFPDKKEDTSQELYIKYRPLATNDSIVVKARVNELAGLPISSPNRAGTNEEAVWTSPNGFYTTTDLSDADTYLAAGHELELELIAGAGAGQTVKITNITGDSGTYSVEIEEDLIGVSAGLKSYFSIDNWKYIDTITSSSSDYAARIPVGMTGKWTQFKIELRGVETTIEELQLYNVNKN